ncbi:MAG: helix-turn-helix domain-containing protein [Gemmatimonadota bacterium]
MRHADQRVTMERAARMLASSRRSLARRCQKAGIPGPARILAFGRLLQAVRLMRRTGWSLERSAAAQGWPDPFTLSNAMLRTTGLRPTQARQFGPVYLAEAWLRRELETGGAKLHAPLPPHCPACGQEVRVTQGG